MRVINIFKLTSSNKCFFSKHFANIKREKLLFVENILKEKNSSSFVEIICNLYLHFSIYNFCNFIRF